ncbi:hypothetical protein [Lederbergia sp. NSJ-179]|nr:hypothetical protein [Lederbergia sp. NSJ-179]
MLKQPNNDSNRKYGWIDKWVKMTGDRARKPILYMKRTGNL